MKRLPLVLIAAIALSGGAALAQGHCPEGHVCVAYDNTVIEVDTALGPIQAVVVEERTTTITDFAGERTQAKVTLLPLLSNGDSFQAGDLMVVERDGAFAEAELGDNFALSEVE